MTGLSISILNLVFIIFAHVTLYFYAILTLGFRIFIINFLGYFLFPQLPKKMQTLPS